MVVNAEATRAVTYTVPCTTADGTVLTSSASATGVDMLGNQVTGTDSTQTTVHAPVLSLSKTATASVNAGEAITYRITYANTGSGTADNAVITDILPADVYYSAALDGGAGPRPDSVTVNADGTRTLTWQVGSIPGASGPQMIEYTARPSLLLLPGTSVHNSATLTFTNANGCTYPPVSATQTTAITQVPPTRDPHTLGYWRNHPAESDRGGARPDAGDRPTLRRGGLRRRRAAGHRRSSRRPRTGWRPAEGAAHAADLDLSQPGHPAYQRLDSDLLGHGRP